MIRAYIKAFLKPVTRAVLPGFATMVMKWLSDFKTRVLADSGTVEDETLTAQILRFIENHNLYDDTKILICPEVAVRTRGTVPLYVTKSYDLSPNNNDAVQTTETKQPFLAGNIAPNERLGSKRIKTTQTGLAHDNISFTTAEPWSFTVALTSFGYEIPGNYEYVNGGGLIGANRSGTFYLRNDSSVQGTTSIIAYRNQRGKINFLTVIGLGTTIKVYFNGSYINEVTLNSNFSFSTDLVNFFRGTIYYRRVQSGAMTQSQVEAEHAMLRSIYPEIESVQIGTQTWATSNLEMAATPMGNPINEMQLDAATEKITNGGFDDATGWTLTSNFTVADGVLKAINAGVTNTATHGTALLSGTWYKVVYTVLNYSSGGVTVSVGGANGTQITANGTYTEYIKATSTSATKFTSGATTSLQIDNVSVKQLGWADSTELYNGLIAQGYTAANAVKEVAWWCYYNNDPVMGATYGKLYNWYAAKLLQTDIDAYNAANPTTPWGWKVPTREMNTTLSSEGGNASKFAGADYWTTDNGLNTNGLSLLGAGIRNSLGAFADIKLSTILVCSDALYVRNIVDGADTFAETAITTEGGSIRLIKT